MSLTGEDRIEVTHVWQCRYRDSSIQSSRSTWCQLLRKKKKKITAPGRNAACKSPQEALFLLAESGGRPQGAQLYSTLVLCGVHS